MNVATRNVAFVIYLILVTWAFWYLKYVDIRGGPATRRQFAWTILALGAMGALAWLADSYLGL